MKQRLAYFRRALQTRVGSLSTHRSILVYQMGKVGSNTVYRSLKQSNLRNPVYHLHTLSADRLRRAKNQNAHVPRHLRLSHLNTSEIIRHRIDRGRERWFVVTLIREPIARAVSDLFQNAKTLCPEVLDEQGRIHPDKAVARITKTFSEFEEATDYVCTWFDREIKPVFGIDVFNEPFDCKSGYQIYDADGAKLLLFRLEDLNERFEEAMAEFLPGHPKIQMVEGNVRTRKRRAADSYEKVKNSLVLPRDVVEKIYCTRFVRHFYSQDMISCFVDRWSSNE